jgi:uncharacterized membrane protein
MEKTKDGSAANEKNAKTDTKKTGGSRVAALGEDPVKAAKIVAEIHGIFYQTVTEKMTRHLGINMGTFRELIEDKNRFIDFLKKKCPQYHKVISENLS